MQLMSVIAAILLSLGSLTGSAIPAAAQSCQFELGFATLALTIPTQVGSCVDNQSYATNGDALQHTTGPVGAGGLLVWRKADNWTAYTDGYHTWINGPYGVQERLNTGPLFAWEGAALGQPAQPLPVQSQPAQSQPAPAPETFGDGTLVVGKEITPGTYRNKSPDPGCYWARLKGFSGALSDIIVNENADGPQIVTIGTRDAGFESNGCGTWTSDLSPISSSPTSPFTDGAYIVGVDIAAGTWQSQGETACYWERDATFSGLTGDIIANDNTTGAAVVTISASDKEFKSNGCGSWTKIG